MGTAYVQGEDVAARGRVLLFSIDRTADNSRTLVSPTTWLLASIFRPFLGAKWVVLLSSFNWFQVSEVYSKELKGAIPALASLQGHLLIASGPKIILHKWTGSELNGVAFCDYPPLHAVSLNIVSTIFSGFSFISEEYYQIKSC